MKTKDSKEVGEGAALSFSRQSSASRLHCYFQIVLQEMRDGFLDPCEHPDSSRSAFSLPPLLFDSPWTYFGSIRIHGTSMAPAAPTEVTCSRRVRRDPGDLSQRWRCHEAWAAGSTPALPCCSSALGPGCAGTAWGIFSACTKLGGYHVARFSSANRAICGIQTLPCVLFFSQLFLAHLMHFRYCHLIASQWQRLKRSLTEATSFKPPLDASQLCGTTHLT